MTRFLQMKLIKVVNEKSNSVCVLNLAACPGFTAASLCCSFMAFCLLILKWRTCTHNWQAAHQLLYFCHFWIGYWSPRCEQNLHLFKRFCSKCLVSDADAWISVYYNLIMWAHMFLPYLPSPKVLFFWHSNLTLLSHTAGKGKMLFQLSPDFFPLDLQGVHALCT